MKGGEGKTLPTEIARFEEFLKMIGFKRSDGAIFGLLVLSPGPLSSEEIGKALDLSQGAVSQGLKTLSHWGAIESRYAPDRRVQRHSATDDSLSIVATIFQKREQSVVESFRRANESARDRFLAEGDSPESARIQRLESYIATCDLARVVMDFVVGLSRLEMRVGNYLKVVRRLPKALGVFVELPRVLGTLKREKKERALWV